MLSIPTHNEAFRVLGIDPGGSSLGLSIVEWTMDKPEFTVTMATTLKMTGRDYPLADMHHNARLAKLFELEDQLHCFLNHYRPHAIASESPFMGQFATAFKSLSECLIIIQRYAYYYNPHLSFNYYAPKQVKSKVGVNLSGSNGRKKEDNRNAIFSFPNLNWLVDRELLDEHAIDATAVALTHLKGFLP